MEILSSTPYFFSVLIVLLVGLSFGLRKKISAFLSKYSARAKLGIIAGCSIFSLLTIVAIESAFMNQLNIEITSIAERDLPIIEKMTKSEFELLESNIFFEKAINSHLLGFEEKKNKYKDESKNLLKKSLQKNNEIVAALSLFIENSKLESEKEEFQYIVKNLVRIDSDLEGLAKEKSELMNILSALSNKQLMARLEKVDSKAISLERQLEEILIHFEEFTEKSALHAEHLEIHALNTSLALSAFLLIFLCILLYMVSQSIAKPITSEVDRINNIINPSISMSNDCLRLSNDLNKSAIEQLESITSTSASCEQIAQTLQVNLDQTEEGKKISIQASRSIDETLKSLNELISSVESLKKSNENMSQFLSIVDTIREKTTVIDEIVFQTKLLSFNASVEAERAGEHGRGFAVVAQEVGNLAKNSGKASVEIADLIKNSIRQVENNISENGNNMNSAILKLEQVSAQCSQVKGDIEKLSATNSSISNTSREQSIGVNQVNEAILSVNQNADTINLNAQELAKISQQIVSNTEELSSSSDVLAVIAYGTKNSNLSAPPKPPKEATKKVAEENVISIHKDSATETTTNQSPDIKMAVNASEGGWDKI